MAWSERKLSGVLRRLDACEEAREWARGKTLAEAWEQCERADWMLWLAAHRVPREKVVLAACACARTALRFVPAGEDRPRKAILVAERWARGRATLDEVRDGAADAADAYADAAAYAAYADAAADAADAYTAAAYAAAYAAYAAAAAAAYAAYAADAADAYTAAAYAAAAYAAYTAADAARTGALKRMAVLVRRRITVADLERGK